MEVTSDQTDIKMSKNLPVGNCGDGVTINSKTTGLMNELYGINALDFQCLAHAVDGSLKHIGQVGQAKSIKCGRALLIQCKKQRTGWPGYWDVEKQERSSSHLIMFHQDGFSA